MRRVELGTVASVHGGGRLGLSGGDFAADGRIPAYGAAGLNGMVDKAEYLDAEAIILSSIGARCGKCFYVNGTWTTLANTQVVHPDSTRVDCKFLWHQLNDERGWHRSGSAQPFIKPSDVKRRLIFLPSLPEQRRIAAILDHADALRAKRRRVLTHLDTLKESIYRETMRQASREVALGDLAQFFGGSSLGSGEAFTGKPDGTLLMKVSDMNAPGNEDAIASAALWTDAATPRSSTVPAGAVVLPKRGASIATNKKRLTTRRTALDPNLMGILPDTAHVVSSYLFAWFKSFNLASITSGSTVPQLNKQDLAPLLVRLPSLDAQMAFDLRVSHADRLRGASLASAGRHVEMFAALQSRAFRGGL